MTITSATASTRLKGIAPQFVVPDVVRSAEHYRDTLGFTIADYFGDPPVFAIVPVWEAIAPASRSVVSEEARR